MTDRVLYDGCKIDGCNGKYASKGYCQKHYEQIKRHGKIMPDIQNILENLPL